MDLLQALVKLAPDGPWGFVILGLLAIVLVLWRQNVAMQKQLTQIAQNTAVQLALLSERLEVANQNHNQNRGGGRR